MKEPKKASEWGKLIRRNTEVDNTAEQGHWMKRPSQISVEIIGTRDAIEAVKIGGSAVVVLQGEILL